MPTYDYECQSCGHRFDEFQNMSDSALTTCPSCNEDALRRLIGGGIGVIFKGSGFYVTDSKSGSSKKSGTAGSNGEGSSDKSDSSTTDSKKNDSSGSESKSTGSTKSETSSKDTKSAAAK
jgi:putative FmdB family regulatory protein